MEVGWQKCAFSFKCSGSVFSVTDGSAAHMYNTSFVAKHAAM
jgi:hypothetical protein